MDRRLRKLLDQVNYVFKIPLFRTEENYAHISHTAILHWWTGFTQGDPTARVADFTAGVILLEKFIQILTVTNEVYFREDKKDSKKQFAVFNNLMYEARYVTLNNDGKYQLRTREEITAATTSKNNRQSAVVSIMARRGIPFNVIRKPLWRKTSLRSDSTTEKL